MSAQAPASPVGATNDYYARATWASFRLDGIDVSYGEVVDALAPGAERPALLRSRQAQRLRNHASVLRHIEADLRQGAPLAVDGVMRWYTTVAAGLPATAMDPTAGGRLDAVVRRVNAPPARVRASVNEIAATYVRSLAEPLVPSFNGILARLLLRYHLGNCGLPAVVFDPARDGRLGTADAVAHRLLELIEGHFDEHLRRASSR